MKNNQRYVGILTSIAAVFFLTTSTAAMNREKTNKKKKKPQTKQKLIDIQLFCKRNNIIECKNSSPPSKNELLQKNLSSAVIMVAEENTKQELEFLKKFRKKDKRSFSYKYFATQIKKKISLKKPSKKPGQLPEPIFKSLLYKLKISVSYKLKQKEIVGWCLIQLRKKHSNKKLLKLALYNIYNEKIMKNEQITKKTIVSAFPLSSDSKTQKEFASLGFAKRSHQKKTFSDVKKIPFVLKKKELVKLCKAALQE